MKKSTKENIVIAVCAGIVLIFYVLFAKACFDEEMRYETEKRRMERVRFQRDSIELEILKNKAVNEQH